MANREKRRRTKWGFVLGFFLISALLYTVLSVAMGGSLWISLVTGLIWAAIFVPGFLWVSKKMNERLSAKSPVGPSAAPRHDPESVDSSGTAMVGSRDGGYFYRGVGQVPWLDPATAGKHLREVSAWRVKEDPSADGVRLRHGSRAWLRIMGAWEWGPKTPDRWPFRAHLVSDPDREVLTVTVVDDFGRWIDIHGAGSSPVQHLAAHGDVLLEHITTELKTLEGNT